MTWLYRTMLGDIARVLGCDPHPDSGEDGELAANLVDEARKLRARALAAEAERDRVIARRALVEGLAECERLRRVVGDIISAAGVMVAFDDDLPTVVRREITRLKGTHWKDEQGQWVLSDEQAIRADECERWAREFDRRADDIDQKMSSHAEGMVDAYSNAAAALRAGEGGSE